MRKIFIALLLCVLAAVVAWKVVYPSGTWRYKITVNVETPEGLKSGSAVREVKISSPIINLPEVTASKSIKGESVVVDLGDRGLLLSLITFNSYEEVFEAFPMEGATTAEGINYYKNLEAGKKGYITKNFPKFVSANIQLDPESIHPVDPKNLSINFGDGVHIKEVSVEITDEPITWGVISKYLKEKRAIGPYEFVQGEKV